MNSLLRNGILKISKSVNLRTAYKIHTTPAVWNIPDYYEVLRVPNTATQTDIKEAYYKLSKVYHPDVKRDESSLNMFRAITEAYDILGNSKSRAEYDNEKFSSKEIFDTTKASFYQSLHKDRLRYGATCAPDYEKLMNKDSVRDEFLRLEERDRQLEIEIDRKKLYDYQHDHFGEYGQQRIMLIILFTVIIKYGWTICEDYLGWGLPDNYEEHWIYPTKT